MPHFYCCPSVPIPIRRVPEHSFAITIRAMLKALRNIAVTLSNKSYDSLTQKCSAAS